METPEFLNENAPKKDQTHFRKVGIVGATMYFIAQAPSLEYAIVTAIVGIAGLVAQTVIDWRKQAWLGKEKP